MRSRDLVVELANSKGFSSLRLDVADGPQALQGIAVNLRQWLDAAVAKADSAGACVTFSVSVHLAGAECDHEVRQ
ncbi:MAG TPA: hypothetical protein VJ801_14660 [Polyangia bacterium]|jgi:hypothetical protein|nr:hypothetical protein [Polyangia bacterium]